MNSFNTSAIREKCRQLTITLSDGAVMPRLGQGTWNIGERPVSRKQEIEALQRGIDLGMTLLDTAEMYGSGRSETLIGEAISDFDRENLFIVSKVYPHNASRKNMQKSCEASLKRLGTDYLDLYLLHWRGGVPLSETVECMEKLVSDGMIRRWGVSNFDTSDMKELWNIPNGNKCQVNQDLYHLASRGIEYDLISWMRSHQVGLMAYCPIAQGGTLRRDILANPAVCAVAKKYNATPIQILLAFVLYTDIAVAIPKAGSIAHVEENAAASLISLTKEDVALLSQAYPAPTHKTYLDLL